MSCLENYPKTHDDSSTLEKSSFYWIIGFKAVDIRLFYMTYLDGSTILDLQVSVTLSFTRSCVTILIASHELAAYSHERKYS